MHSRQDATSGELVCPKPEARDSHHTASKLHYIRRARSHRTESDLAAPTFLRRPSCVGTAEFVFFQVTSLTQLLGRTPRHQSRSFTMRGSGLRVDTRPSAPKTNMVPLSFNTQPQGYMPGADNSTKHNGHHHPSSFSQYQREMCQNQATMNCYSQHPLLPVPQPPRHTVPVDVTSNHNVQRPPVSVPQYHQYLAQCEAATKHHGQGPSPPSLASQTGLGHWVRKIPKADSAYTARQGNQNTGPNGQSRQPASNYLAQKHVQHENHGCTLVNGSNSSGSQLGRQFTGASQPTKRVPGHRAAGPVQNMTSDPRGLQVHCAAPVREPTPAMDMKERQAMTAGLKRLEMLEWSFARLKEDHTRRLVALERKHEELVAYRTNELARYRDVHGLPSTTSREEIGALAAEAGQAHISTRSSRLPCEESTRELDDMVTTPLTHADKSNAPSHDINSVRANIELLSDVSNTNVTPCHKVQARKASKVGIGNARQRSNGESPKPRAGRYNMRERVQGRVQKTATRGL